MTKGSEGAKAGRKPREPPFKQQDNNAYSVNWDPQGMFSMAPHMVSKLVQLDECCPGWLDWTSYDRWLQRPRQGTKFHPWGVIMLRGATLEEVVPRVQLVLTWRVSGFPLKSRVSFISSCCLGLGGGFSSTGTNNKPPLFATVLFCPGHWFPAQFGQVIPGTRWHVGHTSSLKQPEQICHLQGGFANFGGHALWTRLD